ncbi:MAG: Rieske (2Fe-2S) protein [Alphaproteobacteria bacterium]
MSQVADAPLVHVGSVAQLGGAGRRLVKVAGRQIALFLDGERVHACTNRCPHEGYPLIEGSVADGCILTCNWHNWKFDLDSGDTLVGGDTLRRYPVRLVDGEIWVDITDPPRSAVVDAALGNLRRCFDRHEYDRMAREISRLQNAGADPLDAVRAAIGWTYDHLEFGTTHAHAAAPDWLALRDAYGRDDGTRLVPALEIVGNLAWDSQRAPRFPFPDGRRPYDPDSLVAAIEDEDEAAAVGIVRGALAGGADFDDLRRPLARAALAHYQDFGHSLIYVLKTGELIERLGADVAEPLSLVLVRSLIYARREDLIPEFRAYAPALARWDGGGLEPAATPDFAVLSVPRALDRVLASSADTAGLYHALMGAAAWQLLHFDAALQDRTDKPISRNVGWLSFTHAVTFGNAVRVLCTADPALWPRGVLQMACFLGRNAPYTDPDLETARWEVADRDAFFDEWSARLFDHGETEYIVSCHLVKLLTAVRSEVDAAPDAPWAPTLLSATRRFLQSPLKRKHALRTARQALDFTANEG